MTEWLKHALEWLKTSPRYFFPVAVASAAVLFLPEGAIKPLGLTQVRIDYQAYFGAAFLLSFCIIVCDGLVELFTWGHGKYDGRKALNNAIHRLEHLTPQEQEMLGLYLKDKTRTQEFSMENGVVAGLVQANILYPAVQQASIYEFPFNIQPWAWKHLNAHPELVGFDPVSQPRRLP